jgi:MAF protein
MLVETQTGNQPDPALVIAADTIVVSRDGRILEKPRDRADHVRMIRLLRDSRVHSVLTAVCVLAPREDARTPGYELASHTEDTKVYFAQESEGLPDDVVEAYVDTKEGCDKAGGYAVQGIAGSVLIERVEGSVDNVVGLPVRRCLELAERVVFKQDANEAEDEEEE